MTDNLLITTMYDALLEAGIKKEIAIKSLRVFCRKYGGQKIYFSSSLESKRAKEIFDFIYDELDEKNELVPIGISEKITRVVLAQFFGCGEYVPMEFNVFREEIASEFQKEYGEAKDKNTTMIEICKRYNISFVTFFKTLKRHKEINAKRKSKNKNNILF